jgi:hypothetical protein
MPVPRMARQFYISVCLRPCRCPQCLQPRLLDPVYVFSARPHSVCAAVCSVIACYVLLVGASVADATVPAGDGVLAAGLVRRCLHVLSLLPWSCVARRCPASFHRSGGAEAEALLW